MEAQSYKAIQLRIVKDKSATLTPKVLLELAWGMDIFYWNFPILKAWFVLFVCMILWLTNRR